MEQLRGTPETGIIFRYPKPQIESIEHAAADRRLKGFKMHDEPEQTLDARGLKCPLPVLKARKRLKGLEAGAVLRVIADDPAAVIDVPHFCSEQGHSLISQEQTGDGLVFLIRNKIP